MRIGIEAQRIFRHRKHGMDFVALETIKHLQQLDTINTYFVFVNGGEDNSCLEETSNFKIIQFSASYPIWEQILLPKKAKEYQVDILHCTSNTAPIFYKPTLVVTIHDIIYFETNPLWTKGYTMHQRFGNMYRRLVVKRILKNVQKIITVSEFEKQNFLNTLSISKDLIEVVYNGVSPHFKVVSDEVYLKHIKDKYRLPDAFFLFLGNTDPKKNTKNTIIAFAQYCKQYGKAYHLVIGDLQKSVVETYLREADLLEFMSQIQFVGYIHNSELPAIINMACLFLYPSIRESFGIPVLEGMASGTPVITSNTSSMPEVGGDAALFVNPHNIDELVAAIHQLESDKNLQRNLSNKGLERAKKFSWNQTAQQVWEIYKSISIEK